MKKNDRVLQTIPPENEQWLKDLRREIFGSKKGFHPNSHNNKPKTGVRRVTIKVCCSHQQRLAIDEIFSYLPPHTRSCKFLELLNEAMEQNVVEYVEHTNSRSQFHISMPPEQKAKILDYCDRKLEPRSRSAWILHILLTHVPDYASW